MFTWEAARHIQYHKKMEKHGVKVWDYADESAEVSVNGSLRAWAPDWDAAKRIAAETDGAVAEIEAYCYICGLRELDQAGVKIHDFSDDQVEFSVCGGARMWKTDWYAAKAVEAETDVGEANGL